MNLRSLGMISAILGCSYVSATPTIIRVTPETMPDRIDVSITAIECAPFNFPASPWYATVSSNLADVTGEVHISVTLRDPETDEVLFNPGTRAIVEGERVLASISFLPKLLDQVVFQWSDEEPGNKRYEIHLADFYTGERCRE